jgi:hypothetical protein
MNPLDLLDSILIDWASPRVRRLIHTLLLLGTALLTIWLSVDGDWKQALIALVAVLYTASNRSNTPAVTLPAGLDDEYADDEFLETE